MIECGVGSESEGPTASCRKSFIDETDKKLNLLVKSTSVFLGWQQREKDPCQPANPPRGTGFLRVGNFPPVPVPVTRDPYGSHNPYEVKCVRQPERCMNEIVPRSI